MARLGAAKLVMRFARNDARLIGRDPMLVIMLSLVIGMGVALRFALPAIDASLASSGVMPRAPGGMRFSAVFPMLVAFVGLWQAALMPGTVFGFLLLDEKEDDTLTALRVSPAPLEGYLAYRVGLPAALAFFFSLALWPLMGHVALPFSVQLPLALAAAPTAPIVALLLASFADNKVQGLAYTKFTGLAGLVILFGWFVQGPWQWALGVFPPFLICKAFWTALAGSALWWAPLLLGGLLQLGLLLLVLFRFRKIAFGEGSA